MNLAVALQKDVDLLSVLGVCDAVQGGAQIFTARTLDYSSLIALVLLFLIARMPMARLTESVTRRERLHRLQTTG